MIAATIVSTWFGINGFSIILENVYTKGIAWVFTLLGSTVAILVVGFFALRMGEFKNYLSIAEAMGSLYVGKDGLLD